MLQWNAKSKASTITWNDRIARICLRIFQIISRSGLFQFFKIQTRPRGRVRSISGGSERAKRIVIPPTMAKRAKGPSSKGDHRRTKRKRWSARVTERSDALDLEPKVFRSSDPRKIALSLKRSAERSKRRKARPYQSAMSMLNFYINRAGRNLPKRRKRILERAKGELRDVFGRK